MQNLKLINALGQSDGLCTKHIACRLSIKGKGEIVLGDLSKDVYDYPDFVSIIEIGDYSFRSYWCNGALSSKDCINIGSNSIFRQILGKEFNHPFDVINSYDDIFSLIDTLPQFPEAFHDVGQDGLETFIFKQKKKNRDIEFFTLAYDDKKVIELLKSFNWNCRECIDIY
jgi:hypothetical protein